jgi:hypothetical protein
VSAAGFWKAGWMWKHFPELSRSAINTTGKIVCFCNTLFKNLAVHNYTSQVVPATVCFSFGVRSYTQDVQTGREKTPLTVTFIFFRFTGRLKVMSKRRSER